MPPATLPFYNYRGTGFVPARALATVLNADVTWDPASQTVTVRSR